MPTSINHFPDPQAIISADIREITTLGTDNQRYVLEIVFDHTTFDRENDYRMTRDTFDVKWFVSKAQIDSLLFQLETAVAAKFDPQATVETA